MTCKEFEKLIPDFIRRKMDYPTLKEFYSHMQSCEDCKEELTIHFLVNDGLARLESGDAFDLQKEWKSRVDEARRYLIRNAMYLKVGFWLEVFFAILFTVALILLL